MDKLKNAFLIILMVAIVAGTAFGVYYEIQAFNDNLVAETEESNAQMNNNG